MEVETSQFPLQQKKTEKILFLIEENLGAGKKL
jgi:hypothetical protein